MDFSPILDSLNDAQRAAVTASAKHVLVLAGAGSGKTRVLVHRIAWLCRDKGIIPYGILAVTFTNKAAAEMRARVEALLGMSSTGMWMGTFHGLSHRLLRSHWQQTGLPQNFQILDSEDQFRVIRRVTKGLGLDEAKWPPRQSQWFINANKDEARRAKDLDSKDGSVDQQLIRIYFAYEEICERTGVVDFAELLLRSVDLFKRNSDLLADYRNRFRHILVDEFQDTNAIQYTWLKLLAGTQVPMFAVGDDDQSIYGWRGARVENIHSFNSDFDPVDTVLLEQNYRSTGTILAAANHLIQHNTGRLGKNLWTHDSVGDPIHLFAAYNEQDEARFVADQLKQWLDQGRKLSETAVLYRSNAQSRVFEEVFFAQQIPYRVYGGLRFFERAEVKNALAYLRLAAHHSNDASFERIVNLPTRGIGQRTLAALREYSRDYAIPLSEATSVLSQSGELNVRASNALKRFLALLQTMAASLEGLSLQEQVENIIKLSGLKAYYEREPGAKAVDRIENLGELVNAAREFNFDPNQFGDMTRLDAFLSNAALEAGEGQGEAWQDCTRLMTLHSAKGLEFPLVIMVGMEEGLFPHSMSTQESGRLEEERRLCYVGITRAREKLILSYAENRRHYGSVKYYPPSRFLREIPEQLLVELRAGVTISPTLIPRQKTVLKPGNESPFKIGQRVEHAGFGEGLVTECEGVGLHARVQVRFERGGSKWLVLEYAKLQPL
ncbi:MAG: DNA helicase II [Gammaproteobacteria bacterium]|nr:DNA helicase II [Gammaproteobacteria bacterium]